MPRTHMSSERRAAYIALHEAQHEHQAAKRRLQYERERAEHSLQSIIHVKACDLGPVHDAAASVQWWGRVVTTVTGLLEEREKRNPTRTRRN